MNDETRTILILEDDPNDALFVQRALELAGWDGDTVVAPNGEQAITWLRSEQAAAESKAKARPWLVLSDLKMPRMDGFEFLAWLRADPAFRLLPCVVVTSSCDVGDATRAFALGAHGFVVKPVGFDDLERAVRCVLDYWRLSTRCLPSPGRGGAKLGHSHQR